jgi:maleate isomerase
VTSSAGALVRTLHQLGVRRIAIVAPYMKPLTQMVRDYIAATGIDVLNTVSLEVSDNLAVGRLDPHQLPDIARGLHRDGADAVVLSACVQMPSLSAVQIVEDTLGLPIITAATATTYEILTSLHHEPAVHDAGSLLAGALTAVR